MDQKDLFGGYIVAELPSIVIDASDFRQVPDNQEVFLYPDSHVSIIVEVLQRVSQKTDEEAVKFHFEALAHDNGAISSTMKLLFVMRNDQTPSPIILHGSQRIRKFNAVDPDEVDILIALFRVHSEGKSADLVVSMNIPRSLEGRVLVDDPSADAITSDFNALVSSLRIKDYDLFADSVSSESTCALPRSPTYM